MNTYVRDRYMFPNGSILCGIFPEILMRQIFSFREPVLVLNQTSRRFDEIRTPFEIETHLYLLNS